MSHQATLHLHVPSLRWGYVLTPFSHRNQRDKITSYQNLLASLLAPPVSTPNLITFGRHFTTSTSMALVVGRRVLGAFVIALCAGSGLDPKYYRGAEGEEAGGDEVRWEELGTKGFEGEEGGERRREVVEGVLGGGGAAGWCDEQVSRATVRKTIYSLCVSNAFSLMVTDHNSSSARSALAAERRRLARRGSCADADSSRRRLTVSQREMSSQSIRSGAQSFRPSADSLRMISDQEKLAVYIQIVRLLLEVGRAADRESSSFRPSQPEEMTTSSRNAENPLQCGESGQAQTYFSRASLLIHTTEDKETKLSYRLCQVRPSGLPCLHASTSSCFHWISHERLISSPG